MRATAAADLGGHRTRGVNGIHPLDRGQALAGNVVREVDDLHRSPAEL